jgi:RNA polymerase sigma factor FliA
MTTDALPQRSTSPFDEEEQVRAHLPLVDYCVADVLRRLPRHVSRDDLVSAGMAALALAARGFDPGRGVPFSRYASTRIRGALLDELRSHDWASRSVRSRARRQEAAADRLAARLGRPPTREELAAELHVGVSEVEAVEQDVHRAVVLSFNALVAEDAADEVLPATTPAPDQVLLQREQQAYLLDAVETLPERLRVVVRGVFFEERPMAELAAELGVSDSRISQMRAEALRLLRRGLDAHLAPERLPAEDRPDGRVARKHEAYYAAIAARSDYRARLSLPAPRPAADAARASVVA